MTETIRVNVAGGRYDVVIGRGLIGEAAARLRPFLRRPVAAVVMDETVSILHGPALIGALEAGGVAVHALVVQPGESAKSFEGLGDLTERLLDLDLERTDLVVAFGGGVVGDLAGFAAAIYKRGIDFIQMPTTLLAQVDSSVGGKTAIDTAHGKNLVGAFHQPRLVLADLGALDTLPAREMRCGYAEILKAALLGDAAFFAWLEANGAAVLARRPEPLAHAVGRSVGMKAAIVSEDEREAGRRALLNLGHTFAHALETRTGFGEGLKHGEAVGLGCALAFRFSRDLGLCPADEAERAGRAVAAAGLPARLGEITPSAFSGPLSADALIADMARDKKATDGGLTFILTRRIGEAFVARGVEATAVRDFLVSEGATA